MKKVTILFVEDDPFLGFLTKDLLESSNYAVLFSLAAEEALELFIAKNPDLCILDVMLPKMDGFELGRKIRQINKKVPIVYLTARSMKDDVVEGFRIGADDYIRKPFNMEELLLRIETILRRSNITPGHVKETNVISFGAYTFFYKRKVLKLGDKVISLTHRETEILRLLIENKNEIVERELILKSIWGDDSYYNARSMDVFLTKLRSRFKNDPEIEIVNIRGRGFKFMIYEKI